MTNGEMGRMETCRACKSNDMYMFLGLGPHPPANRFLAADELDQPEPSFPLNAHVCLDCALIQVPNYITPDFFRHYLYVPSASETLHKHFTGFAETVTKRFISSPQDLIVDIGSNDGLFLNACKNLGARTLGVEPAANLTEIARGKGLEVVNSYFSSETAQTVLDKYGPAKAITTTNTLNHIDDLHSFVKGVTILLGPDGVFVVEVPHAVDLIENNEFDTIYHEHLSEFSVKSLADLFRFFDMVIVDIERLPIHGGSMRVYAQRKKAHYEVSPGVEAWFESENRAKLFSRETYDGFRSRVEKNRDRLLAMLDKLKHDGNVLAGYGAPAKGSTLLNYYGIGTNYLEFLADKNPLKQELYSPGMHIPVVKPEKILEVQPAYLLILAWNFSDEIIRQQDEYRRRGGKFIMPIPEPEIVN